MAWSVARLMKQRLLLLAAAATASLTGCTATSQPRTVVQAPLSQGAEWRVHFADFQREAGRVHTLVRKDPQFGGLILKWTPEPHAVVMFTSNAEERLARYTLDPRFKARRVEWTLARLEAEKERMTGQLARSRFPCWSVDGDEEYNTVTVRIPQVEALAAEIAAGRIKAPSKVRLLRGGCAQLR